MQKYKSLVLPLALIFGYLFRQLCSILSVTVPYVIFTILLLSFSGVRLASLRCTKLDFWIAAFQTVVSFGIYWLMKSLFSNDIVAQGAMMCVLCPVASSVTVVASMLGANPVRTTTYTIVGNLLVAILAPIYILLITDTQGASAFGESFMLILTKIATVIALPFFVVIVLQRFFPVVNEKLSEYKQMSFYLWAFALLVTIGHTADFVIRHWAISRENVIWLGLVSLLICSLQFSVGKMIGKRFGDSIGGGQILAQKNSAMGIWILNTFMNPIASVAMAFYSIWQNIYNSWQLYGSTKK